MATSYLSASSGRMRQQPDRLHDLIEARASGNARRLRHAEDAVVLAFLPVAGSVANRYRHHGVDYDDLEQVARIGLLKAVRRWRPDLGAFLSYAMPTIQGEVKRHFRDCTYTIRIPRQLYEAQPRVAVAQRALRQEMSREPTPAEIAERAGLSEQQVRDIQAVPGVCQPLSTDDNFEVLEWFRSDDAERDMSMVMVRSNLRPALATLSDRERQMIARRFVWGQSQTEIANALGVSQMQVSRVLRAALVKIRERLETTDAAASQ